MLDFGALCFPPYPPFFLLPLVILTVDLKMGQSWGLSAEPTDKELAPRPGTETADSMEHKIFITWGDWPCPENDCEEGFFLVIWEKTGRQPKLCKGCEPHTFRGVGGKGGIPVVLRGRKTWGKLKAPWDLPKACLCCGCHTVTQGNLV